MLAVALALPLASGAVLLVHRLVHGGRVGMTPLAGYCGAWITVIGLYMVDPLELDQVSTYAWFLIGASFLTFMIGYALGLPLGIGSAKDARSSMAHDAKADPRLTRHSKGLWIVCLVAGAVLFAIYGYRIASVYGLSATTLTDLRIDEGSGLTLSGFYFFIFAEPLVPLSVVLALTNRRRRNLYLTVAALATISLLTTTGRSNAMFALLWAFCAFAIYQGPRLVRFRLVLVAFALVLVAFAIFQVLGDTIGKSYQNSYTYSRFGDQPPIPSELVGPYLYLEGPLPTFSAIVRDTDSFALGRFTFRPVFQVLAIFDHDVTVPPHIQDFQLIPYPFNVSTYLSSFYRDFGLAGVLFGPAAVGFFAGFLYSRWQLWPSPATLCLAAFASVLTIASVGDFLLLDLSRILEITAIAAVAMLETRPRAPVDKHSYATKVFSRT